MKICRGGYLCCVKAEQETVVRPARQLWVLQIRPLPIYVKTAECWAELGKNKLLGSGVRRVQQPCQREHSIIRSGPKQCKYSGFASSSVNTVNLSTNVRANYFADGWDLQVVKYKISTLRVRGCWQFITSKYNPLLVLKVKHFIFVIIEVTVFTIHAIVLFQNF